MKPNNQPKTENKLGGNRTHFPRSVSFNEEWNKNVERRMSELGIASFSEYFRLLVGNDIKSGGSLVIKPSEAVQMKLEIPKAKASRKTKR